MNKIEEIQKILGVEQDGDWGPVTQAALDKLICGGLCGGEVFASSFADPRDVKAFRACKASGKSDDACFAVGDNGIGCWGDDTTGSTPMCAVPPDDMIAKWGSINGAKHKKIRVTVGGKTVVCTLADRMPWKRYIKNGCGIDLNPAACAALGLRPPIKVKATWIWA